jgi:prepilin-type N-terminal cleavage/methylation domain-containing protein
MSKSISNKGFTLFELLIVIVMVGVLATIAVNYYSQIFEKARADEAKQGLWEIRVALGQYRMDHRNPPSGMADLQLSSSEFPTVCRPDKYFRYNVTSTRAIATRCTVGGKGPQGRIAYNITLGLDNSSWGGTPGYY